MQTHLQELLSTRNCPLRLHRLALTRGSLRAGLGAYAIACGRNGAEHADPWSDRRVIEFCLALPFSQRVGGGRTKRLARLATSPWLPAKIRFHTGKEHLGWHLDQGLVRLLPSDRLRTTRGAATTQPLLRFEQLTLDQLSAKKYTNPSVSATVLASALLWQRKIID